ncbi:hypothetical protein [Streptomyces sp. UG1]
MSERLNARGCERLNAHLDGRLDAHLVWVTVLAVVGLVVALCLPSAGQ